MARAMGARVFRISVLMSLGLLIATSAGAAPPLAEVDARALAREMGYAGVAAFEARDYLTALERLQSAYRLLRAPSLGLWSARTLAKLGRLVEAEERYREVEELPISVGAEAIQSRAKIDAAREHVALAPRIPRITFDLQGASPSEVTVTIDGNGAVLEPLRAEHAVDPGHHRVEALRGPAHVRIELTIAEGEGKTVVLRFPPVVAVVAGVTTAAMPRLSKGQHAATPNPSRDGEAVRRSDSLRRMLGWIAIGASSAALVTGATTGLLALDKGNQLARNPACAREACLRSETSTASTVDTYNSLRTISLVGLTSGAVLAAAGVWLVLPLHRPAAEPRLAATVPAQLWFQAQPGGATIGGEF
jgi:hypothetical protein